MILLVLIISLLISHTQQRDCNQVTLATSVDPDIPINDLKTGSIKILADSQVFEANITINLDNQEKRPQIAITIMFIQNYIIEQKRIYFEVTPVYRETYFQIIFNIAPEPTHWTSVSLIYLLTANLNVKAGTFIAQDPQLQQLHSNSKIMNISHKLNLLQNQSFVQQVVLSPFLSGLHSDDPDLYLDIITKNSQFKSNLNQTMVQIQLRNQGPVMLLKITYILYKNFQTDVGVVFFGQSLIDSSNADIIQQNNAFRGMTDYNGTKNEEMNQLNVRLLQQQSPDKQLQKKQSAILFQETFAVSGLRFQNLQVLFAPTAIPLTGNQEKIQCVTLEQCKEIGGLSFYVPAQNGQKERLQCRICRENQVYNFDSERCECIGELIKNRQNKCVTQDQICGQQIYIDGQCWTILLSVPQKKSVSCPKNQIYNETSQKCQCQQSFIQRQIEGGKIECDLCPNQQIWNTDINQCICKIGIKDSDGNCNPCNMKKQKWMVQTQQCICIQPLKRLKGQCSLCARNSVYDELTQTCKCKEGFTGIFCRPTPIKINIQQPSNQTVVTK